MKKNLFFFAVYFSASFFNQSVAQIIPQHDHVVIVFLENRSYTDIVGVSWAPYINSLIGGTKTARFTQSFGLVHPSQPNYLMFFSGSDQGVTDDNDPPTWPFTTPNLGAQLLDGGYSFAGYSEDLPTVGSNVSTNGQYARKHNPWVNWQDASTNGIPAALNQTLTTYPTDYSTLPTLSFVIPNMDNDMHNPTFEILTHNAISNGDTWLQNHLDGYIQWAKTNNSLFILTFDEDGLLNSNHIVSLFIGENVIAGDYNETIDHYSMLRTLEDMYGLPYAGNAANATPITDCWVQSTVVVQEPQNNLNNTLLYPNPASGSMKVEVNAGKQETIHIAISNLLSQTVASYDKEVVTGKNQFSFPLDKLENGTYFVNIISSQRNLVQKIVVQN